MVVFKFQQSVSLFQVSVVQDSVNISGQSNMMQLKVPDCHLAEDLEVLLESGDFTDCTFFVEGKEFRVHKAIIAGTFPLMNCFA